MTFPGFYALSAAWLFLLVAPLVLFYFLKLKRPRLEMPSLVLWRQVLQDNRVNSPFQKFKRNILLLLQLLILLLLILAAMQPYLRGRAQTVRRLPVLIDCSASMAALDAPGGQSRLQRAKDEVRQMIDALRPDQELCLVSFGRTARKLVGFTNNKRELREALDQVEVEDVASDLDDALRMAQALSRTVPFDQVLLLTDGNVPGQSDLELPFTLEYRRLATTGPDDKETKPPNFGITAMSARRADAERWDVFVKVEASPNAQSAATLELLQDGEVVGTQPLAISGGAAPAASQPDAADAAAGFGHRLVFRVAVDKPTTLQARLTVDQFDALPADNTAFINLNPARLLNAYVPAGLGWYRLALKNVPGVRIFPGPADGAPEEYDLLITDSADDLAKVPAVTRLAVGVIPDDLGPLIERTNDKGSVVVDWLKGSPLLQHVELTDVLILDEIRTKPDKEEADFENLGYDTLLYGQHGPLMLMRQDGTRQSYYLLFHTDRSTLPYRVGFPILVWNVAQMAMRQAGLLETFGHRTGVLPPLTLTPPGEKPASRTHTIKPPVGREYQEPSDAHGVLNGVSAPRVGRYVIKTKGTDDTVIGASLLDARETSLAAVDTIQFKEVAVTATTGPAKVDKGLWTLLAAIALGVLLIEWWFYQRRPVIRIRR